MNSGSKAIIYIIFLAIISILLSPIITQIYCDTIDNDTVLEFYWNVAEGNIYKYNVYLSINKGEYVLADATSRTPTASNPYAVPIIALDGSVYQIKVEAVDSNGMIGPMSLPSDPVLCQISSPQIAQSITLNLSAGWNLISCPGDPIISDIPTLIAGKAILPYAKLYNPVTKKYENKTTLEYGKAYWFGVGIDTQLTIKYFPRNTLSAQLLTGWNMVGSISEIAPISAIAVSPYNSIASYGEWWNPATNTYVSEITMEPGKGYWFAASGNCSLIISDPPASTQSNPELELTTTSSKDPTIFNDIKPPPTPSSNINSIKNELSIVNYIITATTGTGGNISPSGTVKVNNNANQTFTITPSTGYFVKDVKVDGKSVDSASSYTFTKVVSNHTIEATFETGTYTITAKAESGGIISPTGSINVNYGEDKTFTIKSSTGYFVKDVKVDGKSVGSVTTYAFTKVVSNHTIEATFETGTYTIIAKAENGGAISPSGSINVNYGEDKTFTITPSTGYHVSDVKVDGKSVGALTTYTFSNVKSKHNIQATFAIADYIITAIAGAGGNISPLGKVNVRGNADQMFSIIPSAGYCVNDVKVDGKSIGSVTTYTFTKVVSNHTIEATFNIGTYTITAKAGNGGTISPSGTTEVKYGANLLFNIVPINGYHIADVKLDAKSVGVEPTYSLTNITQNYTIEVSFAINTYTIIASAGNGGTISPSGSVTVNHTANQEFTIAPSLYYHITDVKVDGKSLGPVQNYTFTSVTSSHIIEASFALDTFTINASANDGGSISPSGEVIVNRGDNKTFAIVPSDGYYIVDVKVDNKSQGALSSYTFTNVTTNHAIEVTFAIKIYTITISVNGEGTTNPSGAITVKHGSSQKVDINPNKGYNIAYISIDGVLQANISNTYVFTDITSDHSMLVVFNNESYVIKTISGPHGFIWPAIVPVSKVMDIPAKYGETKLFNISPDSGYCVANVKVDGNSIGALYTYTFSNVTSNHVLEATFEPKTYVISTVTNGNGTLAPSGTVSVVHGSDQIFTMTLSEGYHIADVLVDGKSVGAVATYTFSNVIADHKIETTIAIDTYSIDATANNGGTIAPLGTTSANHGSDQVFTITPSEGYHIADVLVDGKSVGAITTYTFSNTITNHKIETTFAINTYAINATANNGGTIAPLGTTSVNHGSDQIFTITPSEGYHIADVLVDGKSVGAVATYTFLKVSENHTIEANFAIDEYVYTITASSGYGGTITPSGEVKVKHGEMQKFVMTPSDGYVIQDVRIDGQSMSTISKFVFMNVTANHTIEVKFRLLGNPVKQNTLFQNYPNPFNPETWIPYQLIEDSYVKICIYNVKGELVRKLDLGYKSSGFYLGKDQSAYWDGKNSTGEKVASGIYFYIIQAGKFTATRRMVIMD